MLKTASAEEAEAEDGAVGIQRLVGRNVTSLDTKGPKYRTPRKIGQRAKEKFSNDEARQRKRSRTSINGLEKFQEQPTSACGERL
jgi:hypothetical protein